MELLFYNRVIEIIIVAAAAWIIGSRVLPYLLVWITQEARAVKGRWIK